ncbi:hypothetical protein AOLI_G00176430 [Acnodon oligacanthus]
MKGHRLRKTCRTAPSDKPTLGSIYSARVFTGVITPTAAGERAGAAAWPAGCVFASRLESCCTVLEEVIPYNPIPQRLVCKQQRQSHSCPHVALHLVGTATHYASLVHPHIL